MNQTLLYQKHELELQSLPKIVHALEYHHKNFSTNQELARKELPTFPSLHGVNGTPSEITLSNNIEPRNNAYHDAMAYISVLGKLFYALTSKWMKNFITEIELIKTTPIIFALMPFRHKDAAHRSIDLPLKSEAKCVAVLNAENQNLELAWCIKSQTILGLFGEWEGNLTDKIPYLTYKIKIDNTEAANRKALGNYNKTSPVKSVETILSKTTTEINFQPTLHHPLVTREIIDFFQKITLQALKSQI